MLASETDKIWPKGYISGTFDMFHIGHLNLIRRAKERCGYLVVGVLADECVLRGKQKLPVIPLRERLEIINALKYADEVDVTTVPLLDKVAAWEKYRFDAMFSGDDHANDGWAHEEDDLKALGAELVFFPYTKEVSTTFLQELTLPPRAENAGIAQQIEGGFRRLFPFDKVKKGERIVIYGAGNVGGQFARQIKALDFCEIFAFANTYARDGDRFMGVPCLSPEELKQNIGNFDRVVVASADYRDEILNILRSLSIGPERIV